MKKNDCLVLILISTLLVTGFVSGCVKTDQTKPLQNTIPNLFSQYQNGDYFQIRDGLDQVQNENDPEVLFLSAVTRHAFNEPDSSNQILERLLPSPSPLPDSLINKLYSLKLENHMRLHQYREALDVAQKIVSETKREIDSSSVANTENVALLLEALADSPPQEITSRASTTLQIERDKAGLQRIPATIKDLERTYVLDTGANYSVLMRSEAEKFGLEIMQAGIMVTSATGGKVEADAAVADELTLGNITYKNVMFLVFPDDALSFPQIDYEIPGILGFPLIEAAGEIRFLNDDILHIPAEPPHHNMQNMALKGLSPRVQVGIQLPLSPDSLQFAPIVCTLDTGAPETSLLEPFYQRYRSEVLQQGQPDTVQIGSAGGSKSMPAYQLPNIRLQIGKAVAPLENVMVHTESTFEEARSGLACNIGQDVLGQFEETIMNYRSMSLLLH